ncbi:MAG: GNAT family N-acetyltransferase [Xenococcus sp. (in: cyanobacteria)]
MNQILFTNRIKLSPVGEDELEELHQIWIQPEVRKYLWDDLVIPKTQTQEIITQSLIAFANKLYGLWIARLINENNIIGFTGYWQFFDPPQTQLLYGLSPQYWGQGLATEMSRAMIDYGFKEYEFKTINASIDLENKSSIDVLKRLGMQYIKQENIDGKETIFYQLKSN